ncbi:MAG: hypothetical protein QW327_04775 [Candidatus Odinarchaeota archaeon]
MKPERDVWSDIEEAIQGKLKNYVLVKKSLLGLKSLDLDSMKDWIQEVYKTNLGRAVVYTKIEAKGITVVYTLENRIQNLYFGSNSEEDLVKLVGEFFVKTIMGWF